MIPHDVPNLGWFGTPSPVSQTIDRGSTMYSSFQDHKTETTRRHFPRKGTFADLLVRHVREHGGYAPSIYAAAGIDRRTYSSIVSHPFRPVAKRTAIQFALALRLGRGDADRLLLAAGYALSPAIPEDVVVSAFIASGVYDMFKINDRLLALGMKVMN